MGKPEWLRAELSYRVYVRGLRFGLLGFLVTIALALVGATGIVDGWFRAVVVLLPAAVTGVSIFAGGIAWLLVPDKQRANLDQMSFVGMILRDMVKGIPEYSPDEPGAQLFRRP